MGKVAQYRKIVQEVLERVANYGSHEDSPVETQILFDPIRDHYQICYVGWDGLKRTYGCPFHVDIKDGKLWIQQNNSHLALADEFVKRGIPKEDIVLAFYAPYRRKMTEFAVGEVA
jgi:hypothetical protein